MGLLNTLWLYVRDLTLVVLVQTFMLCQVGFFYVRLRCGTKKKHQLVSPPSETLLRGPLCIIIPVLNEADIIERTLRHLNMMAANPSQTYVVVSDSGCTDDTMAIVQNIAASGELNLIVKTAKAVCPGRGGAIRGGLHEVADVKGALILFLHADTVLPQYFDYEITYAFSRPGVLMTAFRFCTDRKQLISGEGPPTGMAFMEFTVNLRSKLYELPFGDQALAITRDILDMVGGFPDFPILEEYELVQRLRRLSAEGAGKIVTLDSTCFCSPRRWLQRPIWKVNWVNQMTMLRYRAGATPEEIYRYYYGKDPPASPPKLSQS